MSSYNINSYNALFLSEDSLKDYSLIREDVDMQTLKPTIRAVQDYYLYKLLGSSLFCDLQDKIVAGTLNSDEVALIQIYITPCMAWAVMKVAPVFISMKYSNRGVVQMTGPNAQPASTSDLQMLGDMANKHYELYAERLVRFLIANNSLFPTYRQMSQYNDVSPALNGWDSQIALGNKPYRGGLPETAGGSASLNITSGMIAYFNVSKIVTATSHTGNTALFAGSFLAAPSGLPPTASTNFTFYKNATLIPTQAVVSFIDNGNSTCTLTVDTTILGYSFQIGDVISSAGKYA
jgi:hypothetical protein